MIQQKSIKPLCFHQEKHMQKDVIQLRYTIREQIINLSIQCMKSNTKKQNRLFQCILQLAFIIITYNIYNNIITEFITKMQLDQEIESLQNKIETHQKILNDLNTQHEKLQSHITHFREVMIKKSAVNQNTSYQSQSQDPLTRIKKLQKQLENAHNAQKTYHNQLRLLQKKQNSIKNQDPHLLQTQLYETQLKLKNIKDTIRELQATKRKKQKIHKNKVKNEDTGKLTKIIGQVHKNKEILDSYNQKLKICTENVQKKKSILLQLQTKYQQKCQQNNEIPMGYEHFKQRKRQKRREQVSSSKQKIVSSSKKQYQSVRDIIQGQSWGDKVEVSEKCLRQMESKRDVADSALKNAHKKYEKQIEQLEEKVGQLQKEHENLGTRLLQKKKEKELAESNIMQFTKPYQSGSTRTTRKLTPIK